MFRESMAVSRLLGKMILQPEDITGKDLDLPTPEFPGHEAEVKDTIAAAVSELTTLVA